MRDPFRTDAKTRLLREAQVGLSVVAVLLTLFLYVAISKISGRGRHLPDHVLNAPIAETVWPGGPNESGMSPNQYLESQRDQLAHTTKVFESDPPDAHATPAFDNPSLFPKPNLELANSANRHIGQDVNSNSTKKRGSEANASSTHSVKVQSTAIAETPNKDAESLSHFLSKFGANRKKADSSDVVSSKAVETPVKTIDPKMFPAAKIQASVFESPLQETNQSTGVGTVESKSSVQLTAAESSDSNSFSPGRISPGERSPNEFSPNEFSPHDGSADNLTPRPFAPNENVNRQVRVEPSPLRPEFVDPISPVETAADSDSVKKSVIVPQAPALDLAGGSWQPESSTESSTMTSTLTVDVKADLLPKRIPQTLQGDIARAADRDQATSQFDHSGPANNISVEAKQTNDTAGGETAYQEPTYIVREGDSYWSIAQKIYHDPRFFRALYKHNEASFPKFESLLPGTRLATPLKSDLIKLCPDECPGADSEMVVGFAGTSADADSRIYVTQQGDTLFAIAGQNLGQASRYLDILRLNQFRLNPKVDHLSPLPAGVRLVLPSQ